MRSLTKFGLSQVTLQFKDGTDIYRARQLVAERLQGVLERLPAGALPKLAPISTGLGEIFYYSVNYRADAKNKPPTELEQLIELSEIQEYIIKPLLRTVPGIAEINESGGYEKQFVIQPKPDALAEVGMTFSELADLVAQNVENAGGGIISRGTEQLTIRAVSRVNNAEDIANLPLKFGAGVRPLLVKDVAEVKTGTKFRTGAATLNGHETVIGTTMMLAGENSREVAERVKARIAEIQTKLPDGVEIQIQYDRSQLIDRTIDTVKTNLFEGAVLVVVVLLALLGNWRAALIVAAAIPLSFLFALTGMARFGISGNLMSLGAVDFGLIIDGAVVIVENIVRQLGQRQHQLGRALTAEERAAHRARREQTGRQSDVLRRGHHHGRLYPHSRADRHRGEDVPSDGAHRDARARAARWCSRSRSCRCCARSCCAAKSTKATTSLSASSSALYEPTLNISLRLRWLVVAGALVLFAGSLWLFNRLGAEFVPKLDEGSITAMLYKPVGMSIEESLQDRHRSREPAAQGISGGHPRLHPHRHERNRHRPDAAKRERRLHLLQAARRMAENAGPADRTRRSCASRSRPCSRKSTRTTASSSRSPSRCASTKCSKARKPSCR